MKPIPPRFPPAPPAPPGAPRGSGTDPHHYERDQAAGKARFERNEADAETGAPTGAHRIVQWGENCDPTQWEVSVATRCVTVQSINGGAPVPILSEPFVDANGAQSCDLQGRIIYSDGNRFEQQLDLDIGPGFSFGFFGTAVRFEVLLSPRVFLLPQQTFDGQLSRFNSPVSFNNVSAAIQRTRTYASRAIWQFTQTRNVPALNASTLFPRPPGSQYVTIYQDGQGAAEVSFNLENPGNQIVGELGFVGGLRRTDRHRVPGNVTLLRPTSVAVDARRFTVVWEIER